MGRSSFDAGTRVTLGTSVYQRLSGCSCSCSGDNGRLQMASRVWGLAGWRHQVRWGGVQGCRCHGVLWCLLDDVKFASWCGLSRVTLWHGFQCQIPPSLFRSSMRVVSKLPSSAGHAQRIIIRGVFCWSSNCLITLSFHSWCHQLSLPVPVFGHISWELVCMWTKFFFFSSDF